MFFLALIMIMFFYDVGLNQRVSTLIGIQVNQYIKSSDIYPLSMEASS